MNMHKEIQANQHSTDTKARFSWQKMKEQVNKGKIGSEF